MDKTPNSRSVSNETREDCLHNVRIRVQNRKWFCAKCQTNDKAAIGLGKLVAVFKALPQIPESVQNVEQWPSKEEQEAYWKDRDANLDKIESACQWFDEKEKRLPF